MINRIRDVGKRTHCVAADRGRCLKHLKLELRFCRCLSPFSAAGRLRRRGAETEDDFGALTIGLETRLLREHLKLASGERLEGGHTSGWLNAPSWRGHSTRRGHVSHMLHVAAAESVGLGVLASACQPTSRDDSSFVACYSWCGNNLAANCPRCKCQACPLCNRSPGTTTAGSPASLPAPPSWQLDAAWYQQRIDSDATRAPASPATAASPATPAGCCPAAVALYRGRYDDFRCCTDRLGKLARLRPIGAFGWLRASPYVANASIYFVGDSLAEQHFLALACLAWATPGFELRLISHVVPDPSGSEASPSFERVVRAVVEPIGTTLLLTKVSAGVSSLALPVSPTSRHVTDAIATASFLVLGGWHHHVGGAQAGLAALIEKVTRIRNHRFVVPILFVSHVYPHNSNSASRPLACAFVHDPSSFEFTRSNRSCRRPTLMVERLPTHFPGGQHRPDGAYPPSQHDHSELCERSSERSSRDGAWNRHIANESRRHVHSGFRLLRVAQLYLSRGDAHVGIRPGTAATERDCLHWCVAPGVLDMLARVTLAECARYQLEGGRGLHGSD